MARLLIIDDDKDTCEYLKEFFTNRKCIVDTAHSGGDGMATVRQSRPDIVLLDVKMDDMGGLEVLKQIKAIDPTIKVIIVTVAADDKTRQEASALGADDFIKKPLHTSYLEGTVSLKVAALGKQEKN